MKKAFVALLVIIAAVALSSCGMGFKQGIKNFQSDLGGGLPREIIVENTRTGEVVWKYEGKAYIADGAEPGDVTIVYWIGEETKKVDFVGRDYGVRSREK